MNSESNPGRSLFRQVGGTARWIALSSLLGIVTVGSGIGLIAMAIYLLTKSALLGTAASLSLAILGVRFFAVTRVVGRYCERYYGHLATFRVLTQIRVWLFKSLLMSDAIFRSNQRRGDIVTGLVDDVETLQDRMLRVSTPPFVALGALIIGGSVLFAINAVTAVILVAVFLVQAFLLPPLLRSRTRKAASELVALRANRLADATEHIEGFATLTLWGRTDIALDSNHLLNQEEAVLDRRLTSSQAFIDLVIILLTGLCAITILLVIASVDLANSEIWWLAATPLIALTAFEALGPLLAVSEYRASTNAASARLLEMTTPAPVLLRAHASQPESNFDAKQQRNLQPEIRLSDVCFSYDNINRVLHNASLSIPYGATVAIAAPSGSGKSTLLNLLLGFLQSDSGDVAIGGPVPAQPGTKSEPLLAAVMQDDHLFDTSFRDNLLVGKGDATDAELLAVCEIAGLSLFLKNRELGLDAPIGPNGELLSGGERQRLMIARAVLADTPILILDEATEHLEKERRAAVLDSVLAARLGKTTVILAHEKEAFSRADVIYDLVDGGFKQR
ncbi:MAG: thiol reductant ABC exporter subunit CydC [Acidimicrobiales bacterium]